MSAASVSYPGLEYGQSELAQVMRETYDELIGFVTSDEFLALMDEMSTLPAAARPAFVCDVLMNDSELVRRDIVPPEGVLIQRSAFGDRRPTLFCVKKFLPADFTQVWENVNLTFDNRFIDSTVSRAPEIAWRWPLPVAQQARTMAAGGDLEKVRVH